MKKMKWLVAICLFLSACSSGGRQITATYDTSTFKDYMLESDPIDSLNYLVTSDDTDFHLLGNIVDGLVEEDRYGNLSGALATDTGRPNEDATVWEFTLRDQVYWVNSQGETTEYLVTADDFVRGLQYVLTPANQSSYASQVRDIIAGADAYYTGQGEWADVGITAVDSRTLRFTLTRSCSYFNSYLLNGGFYPLCGAFYDIVGANFATSPENMLYNGCYYLSEYSTNEIHYVKNSAYWQADQVNFDEGTIVMMENEEAAFEAFREGDLSYAYLSTNEAISERSSYDHHMYLDTKTYDSQMITYNFASNDANFALAIQNDAFRLALQSAFDIYSVFELESTDSAASNEERSDEQVTEDALTKNQTTESYQSTITPTGFVSTTNNLDYVTLGSLANYSGISLYDVSKANAYMEQAMQELSGTVIFPVNIRIPICVDDSSDLAALQRVISKYSETFEQADQFITFEVLMYAQNEADSSIENLVDYDSVMNSNGYDMTVVSKHAEYGDPSTYLGEFVSTGHLNATYMHLEDPIYDSLFTQSHAIVDLDSRLNALAECEAYLIEKGYVIPFGYGTLSYKVSSINDYSYARGFSGLAHFKLKGITALSNCLTVEEKNEFQTTYETNKNSQ